MRDGGGGDRPATGSTETSGQHLLQVLHLQLPHPPVKRGEPGKVGHLHRVDERLRGGGLDRPHHHDIFACGNSSRWSIVQRPPIQHKRTGTLSHFPCDREVCVPLGCLFKNLPSQTQWTIQITRQQISHEKSNFCVFKQMRFVTSLLYLHLMNMRVHTCPAAAANNGSFLGYFCGSMSS